MELPVPPATRDQVIRFIAATRFPFPGQTDWPPDNVTITNDTVRRQAIATPEGPHWPAIVIVSTAGTIRETAEVEVAHAPDWAARWQASSRAADNHTKSGVQHFFVYVPASLVAQARETLARHAISCAGLRSYDVAEDGTITITPIVTDGDPKDHVVSVST